MQKYCRFYGAKQEIICCDEMWHYREVYTFDGNLDAFRLYDADGYFVAEFPEENEMWKFIKEVRK